MGNPVNDGSMDLPYERHEATIEDAFLISGGVVVMAATVPVGDEKHPALVFRFAAADGSGFYSPVLLGLSREQMETLADLVVKATKDAIAAADEGR